MGKVPEEVRVSIEKTLKNFQKGTGFWIADFRRNLQTNFRMNKGDKIVFDYFLPGTQETKEARFLSKIYEYWINPKYRIGVFFLSEKKQKITKKLILSLIPKILSFMEEYEIRWSWLLLFREKGEEKLKDFLKHLYVYKIGILLAETSSKKIYYSKTFLNKQGKKLIKFG